MFGLYAEEARGSVKIHEGTVQTRPDKLFLQFIKEHRTAWPGVSLLPVAVFFPLIPE
jgi:hypothetical protein